MHLFYVSCDNLLLDIMQAWLELILWKGFGMRLLIQTTPRMVKYCLILRTPWEIGSRCLLHEHSKLWKHGRFKQHQGTCILLLAQPYLVVELDNLDIDYILANQYLQMTDLFLFIEAGCTSNTAGDCGISFSPQRCFCVEKKNLKLNGNKEVNSC